ncbi:MAG TPA: hypothetical protein VFZ66_00990 [Herpetosiphonaceae bacterium]
MGRQMLRLEHEASGSRGAMPGPLLRGLGRLKSYRAALALAFAILIGLAAGPGPTGTRAAPGWQWYKTDPHVHSSISSDAFADIGIHAQAAQTAGYNALFLTDHNGGSSFHINNLTANHMIFEDAYTRWETATFGSLSSSTNALVSTPVNSGSKSLRLRAVSSNGAGETSVWTKRGPNFRSGNIILRVSIYPTRIDANSGVYVSASIGGDTRVGKTPIGYTTQAGVVSPGKSTVLVWQLGSARAPSSDPNTRVLTYSLGPYTLNTWNTYTINVSDALAAIPAADRPLDYNGLTYLKMAAAASSGDTAEAYFDTYAIDASTPVNPADEYVYRTGVVDDFDTPTLKIFPSYEMGQTGHSQRFNFGIADRSQYVSYSNGTEGILETQQSGYPAQINHPGTTITVQEVIDTRGKGADFIEVREQEWIDAWDAILQTGTQIIGSWSSDTHEGVDTSKAATFMYAPALSFDELMHAYFEGRIYNARASFDGRTILNLDSQSLEPYPARYPVYVPATQASIPVHLAVTADVGSSYRVVWVRNGTVIASEGPTSTSAYDATKAVSLADATTYVRAEVRSSTGSLRAMSQPILFVDVPGLPADKSFYIDKITTASGRGYNRITTKGITAASWDSATEALGLTLENPVGALVRLRMATSIAPRRVRVDGTIIAQAGSLAEFEQGSGSIWYYDDAQDRLYVQARHENLIADVKVAFSEVVDTEPPTTPADVTAVAISDRRVALSWTASSDNVGVAGYIIYRDGAEFATTDADTGYIDTTVTPATSYSYQVQARDAAGNLSELSTSATVTTPAPALFIDGWETGDTSQWTSTSGLGVQQQEVFSGLYAARATSTGTATWAYKTLSATQTELYYRVRFKLLSKDANTLYLQRFRTSGGTSILGMYVSSTGKLGYRNDAGARSTTSTTSVTTGVWHELQARLLIDTVSNTAGQVEVWYDGIRVDALSKAEPLGTTPIGRIQVGENSSGRTYDVVFDDVVVDRGFINP